MSGILAALAGVATAGAKLLDRSLFKGTFAPTHATANLDVGSSGTVSGTGSASYTWLLSGSASAYEIRATLTSNSMSSHTGTFGSWLSLAGGQSWTFTENGGSGLATVTLEIRPVGGSPITSCVVSIDCEVA